MSHHSSARLTLRRIAQAAALLVAAQTAAASVDPVTGVLTFGGVTPQDNNLKFEVGPSAGQVRVINNLNGAVLVYSGVTGINFIAGAGSDSLEFDINASQSLALNIGTGSGPANVKIQWKVPPGALATMSSLSMTSGGGDINVELGFESETRDSSFSWNTNFGGGNKLLKSKFQFKAGTVNATKNVHYGQLGGGAHQVFMDVDSDAADARLTLDAGYARDVFYKVISDNPSTRLDVSATVRGDREGIEVLSAAPLTNVNLRGGTGAEAKFSLLQIGGGIVNALIDFVLGAGGSKFEGKFDGSASQLQLSGRLLGSAGSDSIKLESTMATSATMTLDCGASIDTAQSPLPIAANCENYVVK